MGAPAQQEGQRRFSRRTAAKVAGAVTLATALGGVGLAAEIAADIASKGKPAVPPPGYRIPEQHHTVQTASRLSATPARTPRPAARVFEAASATQGWTIDTTPESMRITPVADHRYGPETSREWLENNYQRVQAITYVTDTAGNVVKEYVIVNKKVNEADPDFNVLYESHRDTGTGKFTALQPISQVPMENPRAIVASADGTTILVSGEQPIRSAQDKNEISYDSGAHWKEIPWPYQISGGGSDLFRFSDTRYMVNNGNYEGGKGQAVIKINRGAQEATITAAEWETILATNFNVGAAYDLSIASSNGSEYTLASNGSLSLQEGILLYKNFNPDTASGSVEQIKTVKINNVDENLGYLYGRGMYVDNQGHTHFFTSNENRQVFYDVDLTTKTATKQSYANLLDNKGIPNYMNGRLRIHASDVIIDNQGNKHTWIAGSYYASSADGTSRAVIMNLETGQFFDLAPNNESGIVQQKDMQRVTIDGQPGYELNIAGLGKGFFRINADGTIPDKPLIFTLGGVDNELANTPSPTATAIATPVPVITPLSNKRFLPLAPANNRGIIQNNPSFTPTPLPNAA